MGFFASIGGLAPLQAQEPAIDPASIPMPDLEFRPTPEIEREYDKYYFFQRDETDFATAYDDLRDCDSYSRQFGYRVTGNAAQYAAVAGAIGGALGGALGNALADSLYAAPERRRLRRVNMRTCMGFKGYRIYGLPQGLWDRFNFGGTSGISESRRQELLQIQARVASGPRPGVGEIVQ
jgi:hypothetical protein